MSDTGRSLAIKGLSLIITLPLAVVLRAWALTKLWLWFVTPLLPHGVSSPHWAHILGLSTLFSLLTTSYQPGEKSDYWGRVVHMLLAPPVAVLFGWIYKAFMP